MTLYCNLSLPYLVNVFNMHCDKYPLPRRPSGHHSLTHLAPMHPTLLSRTLTLHTLQLPAPWLTTRSAGTGPALQRPPPIFSPPSSPKQPFQSVTARPHPVQQPNTQKPNAPQNLARNWQGAPAQTGQPSGRCRIVPAAAHTPHILAIPSPQQPSRLVGFHPQHKTDNLAASLGSRGLEHATLTFASLSIQNPLSRTTARNSYAPTPTRTEPGVVLQNAKASLGWPPLHTTFAGASLPPARWPQKTEASTLSPPTIHLHSGDLDPTTLLHPTFPRPAILLGKMLHQFAPCK
jgi:hypothetical protein